MLIRISIAVVFLVAQLSLSWASGAVMDMDRGDAANVAAHAHVQSGDVVADDPSHGESHDDCNCSVECQVCAMTLPSFALVSAYTAPPYEPTFVPRSLPPGTVAHPYRPPANS
jgi:hypothetical protein